MKDYIKYDWPRHKKFILESYRTSNESFVALSFCMGSIFFLLIFALSVVGPSQ